MRTGKITTSCKGTTQTEGTADTQVVLAMTANTRVLLAMAANTQVGLAMMTTMTMRITETKIK
jgi:hypothetical protein